MLTDVDLPTPGLLWTRWATLSTALTGLGGTDEWSVDNRGAHHRTGAGWARFALLEGRRAVLFGHHQVQSTTALADPPLDLLTGAPDWLPWDELTPLAETDQLGFVLWHADGRWSRVRYPQGASDGLKVALHPVLTSENTVTALRGTAAAGRRREEVRAAAEGLLTAAVRNTVDAATLTALTGPISRAHADAALAVAARGGLTAGTRPPRIAPGERPPMRRVRQLSHGEHDRLVWAAMHDATELHRPPPPATDQLAELVGWLRSRSPGRDGRCSLLAYADATSFSAQSGEHPPAERAGEPRYATFRELTTLVRALRRAESDPRYGRWLYLRVETTGTGVRVERRYDSWPDWWHDDGVSGPWRTNLREEMETRAPAWSPSWATLLDPEVAYRPAP